MKFLVPIICSLVAVLLSIQTSIRYRGEFGIGTILYEELAGWYLWGAIFPLVLFITKHRPLTEGNRKKNLPVYIIAGLVIGLLHAYGHHLLYWLPRSSDEAFEFPINTMFFFYLAWRFMIFAALCVVCHAYLAYKLLSEQEARERDLTVALEQIAMEKLKVQLDPDYLFSTFEEILQLMQQKLLTAEIRIAEVGDYLRDRLNPIGLTRIISTDETNRPFTRAIKHEQQWFLWTSVFSIIAMYFFSRQLIAHRLGPDIATITGWLLWIPLSPRVLDYARRQPLTKSSLNTLLQHCTVNAAIVLCLGAFVLILAVLIHFPVSDLNAFLLSRVHRTSFGFDVLTYWTIVAAGTSIHYFEDLNEKRTANSQRHMQLVRAQLQALKMQLHPHFLFNTLNSISQLMYENVGAAMEMLKKLKAFLQLTLVQAEQEEITLSKELEFLNHYLDIQETRFEGRLRVQMEIETRALDCYVPNLLLQPLVENAIRHGIEKRKHGGLIHITAGKQDQNLHVRIQDNGPGMQMHKTIPGLGFEITRTRLYQLYGKAFDLSMENVAEGGFAVTMRLPIRAIERGPA